MSQLRIAIKEDRKTFRPGDTIVGAVGWKRDAAPKHAELRLFWFTRGKGTQDVSIVETEKFDAPQAEEARPFRFTVPAAPYSFSGKLISLVWALELILEPGSETARIELTISPTEQEIILSEVAKK